jgi:Acetyltransferase (GNAT) domain
LHRFPVHRRRGKTASLLRGSLSIYLIELPALSASPNVAKSPVYLAKCLKRLICRAASRHGWPASAAGGCALYPQLQLPLHTARLLLREFIPADDQALQAYASDPEVTRFMVYGPQDAAETAAYLQRMLQSQRERPRRVWGLAVTRREDAQLIGACDVTLDSILKFFQVDKIGMFRRTSSARYFKEGVGSSRPS